MTRPIHCSFCGKGESDVLALIAGPSVFICNECSMLTVDIMLEKMNSAETKNYASTELATRFIGVQALCDEHKTHLIELIAAADQMPQLKHETPRPNMSGRDWDAEDSKRRIAIQFGFFKACETAAPALRALLQPKG